MTFRVCYLLRVTLGALLLCSASAQSVTITRLETDEEFVGPLPGWKNLKTDYGAVGDGVADDTAALRNAFEALRVARQNGWGTLYIPAGTYRITDTVTSRRVDGNNDFLGTQIIGEDPETTIIRYDGPVGRDLLVFDGWYTKMSRFTLDGAGKGKIGLQRDGGFSTYCEISDVYFKDLQGGIAFAGSTNEGGQAETLVIRCRFTRCGTGVATGNFNSLDIWVWWSIFEDCGRGIHNYAGNYHAVGNLFLRSTEWDVGAQNSFNFVVIDNVSIGSRQFADIYFGELLVQRNRVYDYTGPFAARPADHSAFLDNVFKPASASSLAIRTELGQRAILMDNTYTRDFAVQPRPARGETEANPARAIDNNPATSLRTFRREGNIMPLDYIFLPGVTRTAVKYAVTSGPGAFTLQGSNNEGRTWTTLDTRSGLSWSQGQRREFTVAAPAAYSIYRLVFPNGDDFSIAEWELLDANGADLTEQNIGYITADLGAATRTVGDRVVDPATLSTPTSVAMPLTPPRRDRQVFSVARNTGDDAQALQNAIDAAVAAGNRAVVHIRAGYAYTLARTVTIPAGSDIQLIGDGAGREISRLTWGGSGFGPMLLLAGPSRATLRDFTMDGGSPILIDNADQIGGRVYAEQLTGFGGSRPAAGAKSFFFNRVEESDITFVASQSGNVYGTGVAIGGPKRAAGQAAPGQITLATGTYEGLQTHGEVLHGAEMTLLALYSEGARFHMYDLHGSGFLNAIANVDHSVADEFIPTFTVDGFRGRFSYLLNLQGRLTVTAPTNWFNFLGDGSAGSALIALNVFGSSQPGEVVIDDGAPAAQVGYTLNSYSLQTSFAGQVGVEPSDDFLREQLSLLRAMRLEAPTARAAGVTDVKIFRVAATPGRGGNGVEIRAAVPADTVAPTAAPALSVQIPSHHSAALAWTAVPGATLYSVERERVGGESGWSEVKLLEGGRLAYTDVNLDANSAYRYRVRAGNAAGYGPYSATFSGSTPRLSTLARKINAGGPAVGDFARESGLEGIPEDEFDITSNTIDLSGVENPAPMAVYQRSRWDYDNNFTFTFGGFVPGEQVRLRLHFADLRFSNPGERIFNVLVNEVVKLREFDIVAESGGRYKALVKEVEGNADASGLVVVRFRGINWAGNIAGLEAAAVAGPLAPTAPAAVATAHLVRLTWTDTSADETGFRVERAGSDQGPWTEVGQTGANQTVFVDRAVSSPQRYFYRVRAFNAAGHSNASESVTTLTNTTPDPSFSFRLFPGESYPAQSNVSDGGASYELGTEIRVSAPGVVTHLRHYKSPGETGTHIGRVWSATGTQLAQVTFANETASGWQEQALATPLRLTPGVSYFVSVNVNTHYPTTNNGLATAISNGPLSTVVSATNGRYGPPGVFPTNSYLQSNYFRDVVFSADLPAAPGGFQVARASATSATLSWTDAATTETGYILERSADAGGSWETADLLAANSTGATATGLSAGAAYRFRLTATSAVGASASATADLAAEQTAYEAWAATYSLSGDNAPPAADPDADGVNNLLEYALAGDPLVADAEGLPTGVLNPDGDKLTLTFHRARAELTYSIQGSVDLVLWADLQSYGPSDTASVGQNVTFTDTLTLGSANPRRFLRLKVTAP